MTDRVTREEFERGVDVFCGELIPRLAQAFPETVVLEARAWLATLDERALHDAMKQYADDVDRLILRLPDHEIVGAARFDVGMEPVPVAALAMHRLSMLPALMKSQPPSQDDPDLRSFLRQWAIEAWRSYFANAWQKRYGAGG